MAVEIPSDDPLGTPPLPVGNLKVEARGKFVVISSGTSGEVFIFELQTGEAQLTAGAFKCIGKVWTSVPPRRTRSWSSSSNSSEQGKTHDATPLGPGRSDAAIFSLSSRWLATVSPMPSSRSSLHGTVDSQCTSHKPPGLTSHTPPSQPQVTCDLETPDGESVFNKVARDVTQELIKGARWVGDQGMQAWNNYWAKSTNVNAQPNLNSHTTFTPNVQQAQYNFPPTHAHDERPARAGSQSATVNILDLKKLSESQSSKPATALQPIAAFSLPYGCSSVSFAPSGLILFTASAKGDVQHVWDLMRMVHGKLGLASTRDPSTSEKGPAVRQIARFSRLTVASIIDVIWTEPRGDRLAIVTERGTVHIFNLPPTAFHWPPPRRATRPATAPSKEMTTDVDGETAIAPPQTSSAINAALNIVAGKTQPLLAAVRGRPPSTGNTFTGLGSLNFPVGAGTKSGKAVAAGFSKSVGAATGTVNSIRHMGENRLTLPGSANTIKAGCIGWLSGKDRGLIAVTGGGTVRIHRIHQSTNRKVGKRRPSVMGGRPIEFTLPSTDDRPADPRSNKPRNSLRGHWFSPGIATKPARRATVHPLSCAEIETNAPYQPFHTDRRVNFYIYDNAKTPPVISTLSSQAPDPTLWVFGEDIPAMKIVGVDSPLSEDDAADPDQGLLPAQMENLISLQGTEEEGQQVVVTTRRKRGRKGAAAVSGSRYEDETEFFEDDCEVVDFAEERV
ncbi:hypothetical protein MMC12_006723 [Toensbergia leucococca]|nr:hypothetical protein [Toensbergia leucococca]